MLYKFTHSFEMKRLVKYGMKIGKNSIIFNSEEDYGLNPQLVSIGDNCVVASGVRFITNTGMIRDRNSSSSGSIIVHDNSFIGINAIIYPGIEIGPNVIIGAGSIVTDSVLPERCVAGNPAKVTCTLKFYERICKKNQIIRYDNKTKRETLQSFYWDSQDEVLLCNKR